MHRRRDESTPLELSISRDRSVKADAPIQNEKSPTGSFHCFPPLRPTMRPRECGPRRTQSRFRAAEMLRRSRVSASNDALRGKGRELSCTRDESLGFFQPGTRDSACSRLYLLGSYNLAENIVQRLRQLPVRIMRF